MQLHNRPLWSAQRHNGYATAFQVLLIADILVGGEKQIKASFLSNGQQVAIAQRIPSPVLSLGNGMTYEKPLSGAGVP
jgi:hypothetical protein